MGIIAKWGKVDYRQFQELQKKMEKLQVKEEKDFLEACVKELAARLLSKVIKRTPVGGRMIDGEDGKKVFEAKYANGAMGGTLRRGWTANSQRQAEASAAFGGDAGVKKFVDSIQVSRVGNTYTIEIINPVEYASYVEFGHRTRDHKGWVEGKFMLTISEGEVEAKAPAILEKKLMKYLEAMFDDKSDS